jgi:hypothetical protein
MNDVTRQPPPQDPGDLDDRYRRASAADPSRPNAAVRQAVLAHAAKVAAERKSSGNALLVWLRGLTRGWSGPALVGTLAAAAFAGMMILPRVQMFHQARVEMEAPKRVEAPKRMEAPHEEAPREEVTVTGRRKEPGDLQSPAPVVAAPTQASPEESRNTPIAPAAAESKALRDGRAPDIAPNPPRAALSAPSAAKDEQAPAAKSLSKPTEGNAVATAPPTPTTAAEAAGAAAPAPSQDSAAARSAAPSSAQQAGTTAQQSSADGASSQVLEEVTMTGSKIKGISREQLRLNFYFRLAAEKGDLPKLQSLLSQGAFIDTPDGKGATALLLAVQNRHADIVKALLEKDADVNRADSKGTTPLKAAIASKQTDVAEMLREHGAE